MRDLLVREAVVVTAVVEAAVVGFGDPGTRVAIISNLPGNKREPQSNTYDIESTTGLRICSSNQIYRSLGQSIGLLHLKMN